VNKTKEVQALNDMNTCIYTPGKGKIVPLNVTLLVGENCAE